jgi:hypothetical protein
MAVDLLLALGKGPPWTRSGVATRRRVRCYDWQWRDHGTVGAGSALAEPAGSSGICQAFNVSKLRPERPPT